MNGGLGVGGVSAGGISAGLLVLRVAVGAVMIAHGYNHIFRGGRIKGTGGWFESLGMKPGVLHAWLASLTELGAGVMLVFGFLTPLAAAGVVGVMLVAWITNHLKNGFFIFRPGEGWEYVMTLCACGVALGALGGGRFSLDHVFGIHWYGWRGLATAVVAGGGGALLLLAIFWRPVKKEEPAA
jgi:putative oxidoreductase